ncbi:cysteine--tRNA ligase [Candidatus Dependentiae bacterium]|nr:cysteine--tRNA ligase [Candidatus Dependentiae bacterium]
MELFLTNTITGKKEKFIPSSDNKVKMYVCGVTPYDYSHIGHGRCYTNFDVLFRLLKFLNYDVTYVRNITDIDDKILNKAKKEGDLKKYKEIAQKYTQAFHEDMQFLNNLKPSLEPKVTDNINDIIEFIKILIDKGHAYILDNDVYFDINSFSEYGKLSGKKIEDLKMGSRIEVDKRKKNPADFVLWKGNKNNLFWKADWGYGRPGWHIECSVMAQKYLGETIDIHGGGMDLIFPHHENEVAQSECYNLKPFVRYWIHNAFININKEKMSKSLGNFFTMRMIFEKFDPMVLRFYFLQHQYRTPIEFTLKGLNAAQTAYKKLIKLFENIEINNNFSINKIEKYLVLKDMLAALCDDLNTPKLLGILFENSENIKKDNEVLVIVKTFLFKILGLTLLSIEEKVEVTHEIKKLIEERKKARKEKNWKLADEIRDKLNKMGYQVQDKKISN